MLAASLLPALLACIAAAPVPQEEQDYRLAPPDDLIRTEQPKNEGWSAIQYVLLGISGTALFVFGAISCYAALRTRGIAVSTTGLSFEAVTERSKTEKEI